MAESFVRGLKCRLCGKSYPKEPTNFCEDDFGPLEVDYDYPAIAEVISRAKIDLRPFNMWRYRELLPIDGEPTVGPLVGGTPLVPAQRLAAALGVKKLWLKNDAVNFPTLSFKDRVVSVALSKAREFGFETVGCASTGNLANSVAANAAAAGLKSYIFVPSDLEAAKVLGTSIYGAKVIGVHGTYDQVNRLCTQVAFRFGWGFVNINLRPFYAEGSKTMGYEIAEQLGWRVPQHIVSPMAGGSLIGKLHKAFNELEQVGLIASGKCKIYGAQATGCNPITGAFKKGLDTHEPVQKPNTIAKSLAIGDPADGYFAIKIMRETGGWGEDVSDDEIAEAMALLGKTEGVFAETAGGVTVAVTRKLIEQGRIPRDEEIVICITGNGLKTQDAVAGILERPAVINPSLKEVVRIVEGAPVAEPVRARVLSKAHPEAPAGAARAAASGWSGTPTPPGDTMSVRVHIPTPMRQHTENQAVVEVTGGTVQEVVNNLGAKFPALTPRLFDNGQLRRFVNLYLNDEDIRYLDNLTSAVKDGDELSIIPAVAGG